MPNSPSELSRKSWVQPYNSNPSAPTMNEYNPGDERQQLGQSYEMNIHSPTNHGSNTASNNNTQVHPSSTLKSNRGGIFGWGSKRVDPEKSEVIDNDASSQFQDGEKPKHETIEEITVTPSRRLWEGITWLLTWWIPSPLLSGIGRMKRPDVRMAWREKVAICIIIVFLWAVLLFIILGLGLVLCPRQNVYSIMEVGGYNTQNKAYVALRGSCLRYHIFHQDEPRSFLWNYLECNATICGFRRQCYFSCPHSRWLSWSLR